MISTMLSGTAVPPCQNPEDRPAGRRGPGALIRRGHWRIRTLSSVPRRRPGKARPRWPGASARQRHPLRPAYWPGQPRDQASVMTGEPSLGQASAGQAAATVIPRGSARTAGIPAGDAASIRAAIPAGPSYRRSPAGAANSDPPTGICPQPPQPRLQPRRGNAERDDDDNAVRTLTTPTRNRTREPRCRQKRRVPRLGPGDRDYLPGLLSIRDTG